MDKIQTFDEKWILNLSFATQRNGILQPSSEDQKVQYFSSERQQTMFYILDFLQNVATQFNASKSDLLPSFDILPNHSSSSLGPQIHLLMGPNHGLIDLHEAGLVVELQKTQSFEKKVFKKEIYTPIARRLGDIIWQDQKGQKWHLHTLCREIVEDLIEKCLIS